MQYNILDILRVKRGGRMKKIDEYNIIKKISTYIIALSVFAFVVGIIIFIWFGAVGLKIMATSFVLIVFFNLYYKSATRLFIKAQNEEENNETD